MEIRVGPLVRAVSTTSVSIWVELHHPGTVTLSVSSETQVEQRETVQVPTITVGGRYYALPQVQSLRADTWYKYKLIISTQDAFLQKSTSSTPLYQFKTFAQSAEHANSLRLAYGSCRKLDVPEQDTLSAYGDWLISHAEQRNETWPHALLLIGDQIYADYPPPQVHFAASQNVDHASHFADFASLYEYAWTNTPGIREALANIPTYMIFDDHEITNGWNLFSGWRANALRAGQEQLLIDGTVAYWVYQGWGNLLDPERSHHPLAIIMQEAQESGTDALDALRRRIKDEVYGRTVLPWHYTIQSTPPVFVLDTRAERSAIFEDEGETPQQNEERLCTSTRIMSETQMSALRTWLLERQGEPALLASSVPVLLPPLLGLAEYFMGIRPLQKSRVLFLRRLGQRIARQQLRIAINTSFDHWPVFAETWRELLRLLRAQITDVVVLSGDVHFSYAIEGRVLWPRRKNARLYQFVCSPLENSLEEKSLRLVRLQSYLTRSIYGGLSTHTLPLQALTKNVQLSRGHLYQRLIAQVTIEPHADGKQTKIQQVYLGLVNGKLEPVARTKP